MPHTSDTSTWRQDIRQDDKIGAGAMIDGALSVVGENMDLERVKRMHRWERSMTPPKFLRTGKVIYKYKPSYTIKTVLYYPEIAEKARSADANRCRRYVSSTS
jgi:hypothetical protein